MVGTLPQVLVVEGMMCQHNCGSTVQKALSMVAGVERAEVSFLEKKATVWGSASIADLIDAVEMVGFDAADYVGVSREQQEARAPKPPARKAKLPKTIKDETLPCASYSILGDTSVANLRNLKNRLYSLSGVQHVEIIP